MIKKVLGSIAYPLNKIKSCEPIYIVKDSQLSIAIESKGINVFNNTKIQYHFARKVSHVSKPLQKKISSEKQVIQQTPKSQQINNNKPSQVYTFTDLDSDLEKYQGYLNIFNTHTKKAHQKLLVNQSKIIQTIIQKERNDLLEKFLSTNYKNRLANPETIKKISKRFISKVQQNFKKIITSPQQCQSTLERITLLTQFNQCQLLNEFVSLSQKTLNLKNGPNSLVQILDALPSKQCQFLFMYNLLIKEKELPESILQSQHFGLNTDNLKFHKLGEVFYEVRKFMRRYFAQYSKKTEKNQNDEQIKEEDLKTFQRQFQKTSQSSLIQNDVACFLKTLGYQNVRHQIQIDGFVVDFVVDKINSKPSFLKKQSSNPTNETYILQVMGSYHYTSTGKLKAKDLRKLILLGSKYRMKNYIIKLIHFDEYNKSKGHRNKMELIRNLLESHDKKINWQPKNEGYDSKWQLREVYDEFK